MPPPPVVYSSPPRFDCTNPDDVEAAQHYLDTHGYAVIAGVLDPEQVLHARSLLWDWLENESGFPISRTNPETWHQWPKWTGTGVIPVNGIGHSDLLWFVRTVPAVRAVFERIWSTSDLIVSFDGAGVFRPWQYEPRWKTSGGWYHVDQSGHVLPKRECVQGLVSLFDQTDSTGGLVVVPGTQRLFKDVTARHARGDNHFVRIKGGWDDSLLAGCQPILVGCKAGDLVLWDSRTVHCNSPSLVPPAAPVAGEPLDLLRAVAYVCMVPRTKAKFAVLSSRRAAAAGRITTSHWPQFYFPNHAAMPGERELSPEERALV